jgi:hypothetical protein
MLTVFMVMVFGFCGQTLRPKAAAPLQSAANRSSNQSTQQNEAPSRDLLSTYCVGCHNERLKNGGLSLEQADVERIADNPELWEKIAWKIRIGAMPKVPAPRPDAATLERFVSSVEKTLDQAAAASPKAGRPALRRLNRQEYVNAIRDLLALEVDGPTLLPPDESNHGFDNGQGLSVTPSLLDRYMATAAKISRLALGDPTIPPVTEVYNLTITTQQNERMSEDLPFGTSGGIAVRHTFSADGEYEIRVTTPQFGRQKSEVIATLDRVPVGRWSLEPPASARLQIVAAEADENGNRAARDEPLTTRFVAKAGTRTVGVAFLNTRSGYLETLGGGVAGGLVPARTASVGTIESLAVSGPYGAIIPASSASRQRILICSPNEKPERVCARTVLGRLARGAFRRPVTSSDMDVLMQFYDEGRRAGGFDGGIRAALERILISPEFLFRIERGSDFAKPGTVFRISDLELASRLSFFLWSSVPDDELLEAAERKKLSDPIVLTKQTRRMLADPRARLLAANFAGQWLMTRNTRVIKPDPAAFPDFDDNLKDALAQETELFFESQVRDDKSVLDLLRADYTYLNERLAMHYGIPSVYGSHFRRVTLTDERRFGILGKGSVMMVTSHYDRTSPVVRGKWIMESLLGAPPPPPPPNVPPLPASNAERPTTIRERLELHRRNAVCASCHSMMDPFGFALENFGVTGQWRDTDGGKPIDTSAVLLDGSKVEGVVGLRNALLKRGSQFVTVFTERLLTYALGRGVEAYDRPALRQIVREAAPHDYRYSDLILGIVQSGPFQMNRTALQVEIAEEQTVGERNR